MMIVNGVVPSRTPKEILKNIKLEVSGGKAVLIGTDQEVGIRQDVPNVESESSGEVLLPAARVVSILRELTTDTLTLRIDESSAVIQSNRSEFRLSIENGEEFPPVAEFDAANYYTVAAKTLKEMIRRTLFATDTESARYALGGVLVDIADKQITLVATDSRRLAVVSGECQPIGLVDPILGRAVVPNKAMKLISDSLPDAADDVLISVQQNSILVKCGGTTIYSRLVEGRFPRYADVIPKGFMATIDIPAGPLHAAVRQSQIVTSEESRGVDFAFENGMLNLGSRAADVGTSRIELPMSYDGTPVTITFDPKYVADFLKIVDPARNVTVNIVDGESAVLFTLDGYRYVVMPLGNQQ
jgi:DNA polymerase-3 subunit beta